MRFLYIVLVTIGLFGCGVEEDPPVAPVPVVNVARARCNYSADRGNGSTAHGERASRLCQRYGKTLRSAGCCPRLSPALGRSTITNISRGAASFWQLSSAAARR